MGMGRDKARKTCRNGVFLVTLQTVKDTSCKECREKERKENEKIRVTYFIDHKLPCGAGSASGIWQDVGIRATNRIRTGRTK